MNWEFDLLYALQEIHTPILDKIMVFLSTLGNAGILWIAAGVFFCIFPKYRKMGFQMIAAMAFTFLVGNLILKNLVARQRPCWLRPEMTLLVASPGDYSFPSGHSMNGFTAAVTMLCCDRRIGVPAVILASLIAFSRLYLFVHFPTDVFAGIVIGIVIALIVNRCFMKMNSKRNVKKEDVK